MERLPSLYPMPRNREQYEQILRVAETRPLVEETAAALHKVLRMEDGQPYKWKSQMIQRITSNLFKTRILEKDGDQACLPPHGFDWYESAEKLEWFFENTVRKWAFDFPDGFRLVIDILRALDRRGQAERDVVASLVGTAESPGKYDPRDTYADRTIREVLKILAFTGWILLTGGKYSLTSEGRKARSDLPRYDPLHQAERLLGRGTALETSGLDDRMKADLAKYYMYRQCGGKGRSRFAEQAWDAVFTPLKPFNPTTKTASRRRKRIQKPTLRSEIRVALKKSRAERERLLDAIRHIDEDLGKRSKAVGSNEKLHLIYQALERGDAAAANEIFSRSVGKFSWETVRKLRHGGPPYTLAESIKPFQWQTQALAAWNDANRQGVLAVVTGAGKTVFALQAIQQVIQDSPDLVVTVIVPTRVLMFQWATEIVRLLGVPPDDIGLRGDRYKDSHAAGKRVLVCVVNSAIQKEFLRHDLEAIPSAVPHLLIADECHRFQGEKFQKAFDCRKDFSLGLSATPSESKQNHEGKSHLDTSLQQGLGDIFFAYSYREALDDDIIQPFVVKYYGVDLLPHERERYDRHTTKIRKAIDRIRRIYGPRIDAMKVPSFDQKLQILLKDENPDRSISDYFSHVRRRKDLIYGAVNRKRCYLDLIRQHTVEMDRDVGKQDKVIVFHERIDHLEEIVAPLDHRKKYESDSERQDDEEGAGPGPGAKYREFPDEKEVDIAIVDLFERPTFRPVMYHSGHARQQWNEIAMELFRRGTCNVMLSVKALIEGVDVPAANVGIVRASSSSVRQRIQTTGRILRRAESKTSESIFYVIYVRDTTDERIFQGVDWEEEMGSSAVEAYYWIPPEDFNAVGGQAVPGELPYVPTYEEEVWTPVDIDGLSPGDQYPGKYAGIEMHVDANGKPYRRTRDGRVFIQNPEVQEAAGLVFTLKRGGKFVLTPQNHMVTKLKDGSLIFLGTTPELEYVPLGTVRRSAGKNGPPRFEDLIKALGQKAARKPTKDRDN